jgi:hypothetical protein
VRRLVAVIALALTFAIVVPGAVGASGGAPVPITFDAEFTGSWASVGDTLRIDPGSWTGQPTAYASDWYRCDGSGKNCALVPGVFPLQYTLTSDDLGKTLFAVVTATNDSGSGSVSSYLSGVIGAPTVVTQPVLTGDANIEGSTLSVTTGTWTGSPTGYTYQWSACDSTAFVCTAIPGATGSTFQVTKSAYNQDYLIVDVNAVAASGVSDNGQHPAFAAGEAHTDVISTSGPASAPVAVVQPYWVGDATTAGNLLTGDTGVWREHPSSLSYAWYVCDVTCSVFPGTSQHLTYTVQAGDLGHNIEFAVDATNIAGISARFGFFGYVFNNTYSSHAGPAGAPEPRTVPTLTGDAEGIGSVLQVTGVVWFAPLDTDISQTYQWLRCDPDGVSHCDNAGETDVPDHEVTADDLGHAIYVIVHATNSYGTTSIPSATTTPPVGAPIDSDPPVISGDVGGGGGTLSASTGDWVNAPTSFAYQWYSCDDTGANCDAIPGATDSTYQVTDADVGTTLLVEVDASNGHGHGFADSAPSDVIGTPYPATAPALGSTDVLQDGTPVAELGDTLSVGQGTWHGAPTSFTYQWYLCDPSSPTRADFNNCNPIAGATTNHYTTVSGDRGHTIYVEVDATNGFGTGAAYAWPNGSIGVPQPLLDNGSITGTAQVGQTLTFVNGSSWTGDTPITWFYRWSRCGTAGANCATISGATASAYTLVSADAGHVIQGLIWGSNVWGANGWGLSYNTAVVAAASSGGGGGGGGGVPLDLSAGIAASAVQVAPGGAVLFHVTVTDVSKSPATHLHVLVQVPAGSQVVASSTDRGPGCQPSATPGWLDCNLDYLSGNPTDGNVLITLTFPNAGSQTVTANVKADQTETVLTNNTASATVQVGSPPPPPPPPVVTPPPLKTPVLKQLNTRMLSGVVRGTTETVTAKFSANEALRLRLTVTRQHQTRRILLRKGSYLAGTTSKKAGYTLTRSVGRAGTYSLRALLSHSGLTKGATYVIHLVATSANGTTRTLGILFRP